jgi:hypothetical protein
MKAWLKGGIWGFALFIVLALLIMFTPILGTDYSFGYQIILLPLLAILIIIGALIGWLVGRK